MASMRRRVQRGRRDRARPTGRVVGTTEDAATGEVLRTMVSPRQPRHPSDPPTPRQVRRKDLWDDYVDGGGRAHAPREPMFEAMADLP